MFSFCSFLPPGSQLVENFTLCVIYWNVFSLQSTVCFPFLLGCLWESSEAWRYLEFSDFLILKQTCLARFAWAAEIQISAVSQSTKSCQASFYFIIAWKCLIPISSAFNSGTPGCQLDHLFYLLSPSFLPSGEERWREQALRMRISQWYQWDCVYLPH